MYELPATLPEVAQSLIRLRQKPSTQEHFKAYPALLQRFRDLLAACTDPAILRRTLALDNGYYLLAGDRQQMLEKWLACERTPEVLRLYAMQLMLFGNVDAFGEADTNTDALVAALEQEADALEQQPPAPAAQPNPDPDRDRAAES